MRPLGVGEILDVSIKLYLKNAAPLLKIVAVVVIPVSVLTLLISLSSVPEGTRVSDGQLELPTTASSTQWLVAVGLGQALATLATLLATGAAFKAVAEAYLGGRPSAATSLRFASGRFLSLIWVTVLSLLAVMVGILLLIIPGIYLSVALAVVVPALFVEDVKGIAALRRSRHLVKGRWWPTLGALLLGWLVIPMVIGIVVELVFRIVLVTQAESVTALMMISGASGTIAEILATPVSVAVLTVMYFDLRVRKEGFDLQLLAEQIGREPSDQRPPLARPPSVPGETPQQPS